MVANHSSVSSLRHAFHRAIFKIEFIWQCGATRRANNNLVRVEIAIFTRAGVKKKGTLRLMRIHTLLDLALFSPHRVHLITVQHHLTYIILFRLAPPDEKHEILNEGGRIDFILVNRTLMAHVEPDNGLSLLW